MNANNEFSISARRKSFQYAFDGIRQFFRTEHNSRIHLVSTGLAVAGAILLPLTATEYILVTIAIALVWIAEIFNTCIERMLDIVSPQKDPRVRYIKDLAAGAVLLAAVTALLTGLFIFIPKLF